jgi:hypothetical protein
VAPPSALTPPIPGAPGIGGTETGPESITGTAVPASFTASPVEPPSPWVTAAIGLGAAVLSVGSVFWLGRRFGW